MGNRAVRLYGQRLSAGVRALAAVGRGLGIPSSHALCVNHILIRRSRMCMPARGTSSQAALTAVGNAANEMCALQKARPPALQRLEHDFHASDVTGAETFQDAADELERRERAAAASTREVSLLTADANDHGRDSV